MISTPTMHPYQSNRNNALICMSSIDSGKPLIFLSALAESRSFRQASRQWPGKRASVTSHLPVSGDPESFLPQTTSSRTSQQHLQDATTDHHPPPLDAPGVCDALPDRDWFVLSPISFSPSPSPQAVAKLFSAGSHARTEEECGGGF